MRQSAEILASAAKMSARASAEPDNDWIKAFKRGVAAKDASAPLIDHAQQLQMKPISYGS